MNTANPPILKHLIIDIKRTKINLKMSILAEYIARRKKGRKRKRCKNQMQQNNRKWHRVDTE